MKLPDKAIQILRDQKLEGSFTRQEVYDILKQMYLNPHKHDTNRKIILEASGIAAYQESSGAVKILLTDDAPQFKGVTERLALCWIHEGRHYKKLTPYLYLHQEAVDNFLKGTEAKDTFMTIVETAKKHSVNVYTYLHDRITKKYEMPSLASLIRVQNQTLATTSP